MLSCGRVFLVVPELHTTPRQFDRFQVQRVEDNILRILNTIEDEEFVPGIAGAKSLLTKMGLFKTIEVRFA